METLETDISRHPFFRGLSDKHLRIIADAAMRTQFQSGEVIFREGDPANRFYLIEEGKVVLEWARPGNKPIFIQTMGAGEVLGWSWLFPPYCWNFDARAVEPTRAIFIYGTRLRENCEEDHDLGYVLMKRLSQVLLDRLQVTRKHFLAATPRS